MLRNKNTKLLSEIAYFFTSDQRAIRKIFALYRTMGISIFHIGVHDKPQGMYREMDILLTLLLSPLANTNGSGNTLDWFRKTMDAEKGVISRFMNDCRLRWRSIIDGINCKLLSCIDVSSPSDACLILDDTDLKKTGFKMELVNRIWSHVDNKGSAWLQRAETMGDLFHEVAGKMAELTLSERMWAIIAELPQLVADFIDIDFASLVQSLMQTGDQELKLMRLVTFSNAHAA